MNYLVKTRSGIEVSVHDNISQALDAAPSHGAGTKVLRKDDGEELAVMPAPMRDFGARAEVFS